MPPMDESGEKEMTFFFQESEYAVPGCGEVGRIYVSGYEKGSSLNVVETALRNHFSHCGKITDVYVPRFENKSYVYFIGEGAVHNALQLNGTDVGGWTVKIKPFPFLPYAERFVSLTVEGFDASLSTIDIERELIKIFSSCGSVYDVFVHNSDAELLVNGEDAAEKVPKLNGSSFMGDHKLVVRDVYYPKIPITHRRARGRMLGRPVPNCGKGMLKTI